MSTGRSVGSLETWQPDDKSFNKHVLHEGVGELMPNDESVCVVHIVSIGKSHAEKLNIFYHACEVFLSDSKSNFQLSVFVSSSSSSS